MRFCFATNPNTFADGAMNDLKLPNVLCAFPYARSLEVMTYRPDYLLLDSGAFTAWVSGKEIDIVAFADWALSKQTIANKVVTVNLDVIPARFGRSSTQKERAMGMKQSIENADYLRSRGLEVAEVFHQDEPLIYLETLLDRLPFGQILGISPRNDVQVKAKEAWQSVVLRHLIGRYGIENLPKTHGLAVTAMRLMRSFPYYSVDSSTWMSPQRFGTYTNRLGKTEPVENFLPKRVTVKIGPEGIRLMMRESAESFLHIGKDITTLWEHRGVTWKD